MRSLCLNEFTYVSWSHMASRVYVYVCISKKGYLCFDI